MTAKALSRTLHLFPLPTMIPLSTFDETIHRRSLLKHPFYLKWSKGELTLEDLRVYAKEYYHLVERIPGIVSRVSDRVTDPLLKSRIQQNYVEEQEHVDLWKRFSRSLGISEAELTAYQPSVKTQRAIYALESVAERTPDEGIACMYSLECELAEIAATKKQGLTEFYNLTSEDAHIYFDEHLLEERHLQVWRMFPVNGSLAKCAVDTSLASQHAVLDAVCEARGISLEECACV
jgi:pyrroloquinoline-quinone synthase